MKLKLGLTLGLSARLVPEREELARQVAIELPNAFHSRPIIGQLAFPLFVTSMISVRPLGSSGITRLPSYYGPVRLPARPANGYVFPPAVGAITPAEPGLPGSSV